MAEVEESGLVRCERCGALKPAAGCACGGQGRGQPTVPTGWDPELTRSSRPRLQVVLKPATAPAPAAPGRETPEPAAPEPAAPDTQRPA